MTRLITSPNLQGPDDVYDAFVHLHEGLTEAESLRVWAKLALCLANHIGDRSVIEQAVAIARPAFRGRAENVES